MVVILTQNVCGLRDDKKRKEVFWYHRSKADIVCFQETHSSPQDEAIWRNQWRGLTFLSHGTNRSKGVFVGVRQNFPMNVISVKIDKTGRYVVLQFSHENEKFVLVNLYAPNRDNPEFFLEAFRSTEILVGKRILCGDFNLTLVPEVDRVSHTGRVSNNKVATETLSNYMVDTMMVDIWRI